MFLVRILVLLMGTGVILIVISSAVRTFVVPRGAADRMTAAIFVSMRYVFDLPLRWRSKLARERALAYYAPVTLLSLPVIWLACLLVGYMAVYWALDASSWGDAFTVSRLSLLYLGSNVSAGQVQTVFAFSETVFSLMLAAILVSYLPTMYGAFSQREVAVTGLETRAGSPPSPYKMLVRYHLIQGLEEVGEVWPPWQGWFQLVEESHTALQPLVFYRSPQPDRSWVTAAGAVLDAAALVSSTVDLPRDPQAELCIRSGYLCLQRIAEVFGIPYNPDPSPTDFITISREEYDEVYDAMASKGVPLKKDRDQAWRNFAGWRVNYDVVLVALAVLTIAPPAPWSSDRVTSPRRLLRSSHRAARVAARDILAGRRPG